MFWGQMTPERATFPPPYSWVLGREKTGATYKVEGVVPGNMSHTVCPVLASGVGMPPETPEPTQKACSTVCLKWLEPQVTHCQGEPSSRGHTEAALTPLLGQAYSWLPSAFPILLTATLPFLNCPGLENQIKPRSPLGTPHSSLSAKHALPHLNLTTAPRGGGQAGISCVTVQVI